MKSHSTTKPSEMQSNFSIELPRGLRTRTPPPPIPNTATQRALAPKTIKFPVFPNQDTPTRVTHTPAVVPGVRVALLRKKKTPVHLARFPTAFHFRIFAPFLIKILFTSPFFPHPSLLAWGNKHPFPPIFFCAQSLHPKIERLVWSLRVFPPPLLS